MIHVSFYLLFLVELIWNCIIPVNRKLVKKVRTSLDSLKTSGADCVPVVVLKNFKPELSYILAEIFNVCVK